MIIIINLQYEIYIFLDWLKSWMDRGHNSQLYFGLPRSVSNCLCRYQNPKLWPLQMSPILACISWPRAYNSNTLKFSAQLSFSLLHTRNLSASSFLWGKKKNQKKNLSCECFKWLMHSIRSKPARLSPLPQWEGIDTPTSQKSSPDRQPRPQGGILYIWH